MMLAGRSIAPDLEAEGGHARFDLPDWPTFGFADDIRPALRRARERRTPVALATIVGQDGGGPRPIGTQMLISREEVCGFLSGGCVESDVAQHALLTIADGAPRRLAYGEGSPWPDIRLLCGARMELLVERIDPDDAAVGQLLELYEQRQLATWMSDGRRRACRPTDGLAPWPNAVSQVYQPACRLIVLGRDPTAMAMAVLGAQSGMETWLLRHLGPESGPGLPGVAYRGGDSIAALQALRPDRWTAIAVANHDLDLDHACLVDALASEAFYVGLLGAQRRLPQRLAALAQAGLSPAALGRLRAPIGVDIGGKAPWEISVGVIAEVMSVGRRPGLGPARAKPAEMS
jgi:xanthine dehydrogenase accessory factor